MGEVCQPVRQAMPLFTAEMVASFIGMEECKIHRKIMEKNKKIEIEVQDKQLELARSRPKMRENRKLYRRQTVFRGEHMEQGIIIGA